MTDFQIYQKWLLMVFSHRLSHNYVYAVLAGLFYVNIKALLLGEKKVL